MPFLPALALAISACSEASSPSEPESVQAPDQPSLSVITEVTQTRLGTLGGGWSVAMDINDAGSVVGWSETANGAVHPFLWTAADGIQDLGVIPGPPRGSFTPHSSQAWSINDQGVIAGTSSNSADGRLCPCWGWIRYPDGRTEDFGTISGSYPAQGVKLNNADEAAGTGYLAGGGGAFVWRWTLLGGLEAVTTPTWQIQDYATGFNDHGEIVGTVEGSSDAVLWDANNVRTDLVGMDDPLAINNLSQVVGTGQTVGYVLWAEGVLTDITSLGVSPWDINDSGQMSQHR